MASSLRQHINNFKSERYKSFIIYGDAGIGKSDYIQEFILKNKDIKIICFNIIDEYKKIQSVQSIFEFTPKKFLKWTLSLLTVTELEKLDALIIDNFDFLVNVWSTEDKKEFLKQVEKQLENSVISIPVIFILHSDQNMENYHNIPFIVRFSDLELLNNY